MGTELVINGKRHSYPDNTKISELKKDIGFPEDDLVVYTSKDETLHGVLDDQTVDVIPDGVRVTSQPNRKMLFGTPACR